MVCEQVEITVYNNIGGSTWKYILSAARGGSWSWQVVVGMGRNCLAASSTRELGKNCVGGWDHCCSCSGQCLCPHSHVSSFSKPEHLWLSCRQAFMQEAQWLLPHQWTASVMKKFPADHYCWKSSNVRFFFLKKAGCAWPGKEEHWLARRLGGSSNPQLSFKLLKTWNKCLVLQRCRLDLMVSVKWCIICCLTHS